MTHIVQIYKHYKHQTLCPEDCAQFIFSWDQRTQCLQNKKQQTFEPVREKTNNLGPTRSDRDRAVQSQKMDRDWKFWIESRGIVLSV